MEGRTGLTVPSLAPPPGRHVPLATPSITTRVISLRPHSPCSHVFVQQITKKIEEEEEHIKKKKKKKKPSYLQPREVASVVFPWLVHIWTINRQLKPHNDETDVYGMCINKKAMPKAKKIIDCKSPKEAV